MSQDDLKNRASELLEQAGIHIDGDAPIDLRVHDERLYARVFARGSLGLGEAYMDGWWDADDLPGLRESARGRGQSGHRLCGQGAQRMATRCC